MVGRQGAITSVTSLHRYIKWCGISNFSHGRSPFQAVLDWLTGWGLTALSAQICYIVPLKSMLQLNSWN